MRYEIDLKYLPQGAALNSADKGENVEVITTDFATDEQGRTFYKYLENLDNMFLQPYRNEGFHVSTIDHCLVLMDSKAGKAVVYINELDFIPSAIPKRDVSAGDTIFKQDIGGIVSLSFENVPIPDTSGIIFYFSVDWKRGIFFDFRPNIAGGKKLDKIDQRLGAFYEALLFYEIHSVNKATWEKIITAGWFPFVSLLGSEEFRGLVDRVNEEKPIGLREDLVLDLYDKEKLLAIQAKFQRADYLKPHISHLNAGIERYLAGDFISAINNIWPRIEGILRYAYTGGESRLSQAILAESIKDIVANQSISPSIFFPEAFKDYLLKIYFRGFDLQAAQLEVSRNSIGHGVSNPETYTRKHALLGILIVDQLFHYLAIRKPQKK